MRKLEMFAVCESCSIDQATNRLSLFNILEETHSEGLPVKLQTMACVSLWLFDAAEFGRDALSRVLVRRPNGEMFKEFPQGFTVETLRQRLVITLEGFAFDAAGDWQFEIKLDDESFAHHTVSVNPPTPAPAS